MHSLSPSLSPRLISAENGAGRGEWAALPSATTAPVKTPELYVCGSMNVKQGNAEGDCERCNRSDWLAGKYYSSAPFGTSPSLGVWRWRAARDWIECTLFLGLSVAKRYFSHTFFFCFLVLVNLLGNQRANSWNSQHKLRWLPLIAALKQSDIFLVIMGFGNIK